jgi:hypothetical protein
MSLIVTSKRRYQVSGVISMQLKVIRHLHRDLGREKGVWRDASVIRGLKGMGVGHSHAVVCL